VPDASAGSQRRGYLVTEAQQGVDDERVLDVHEHADRRIDA
jgi:hypothetical protein